MLRSAVLFFATLYLTACTGIPQNIKPVENFQLDAYLGQWHEIARLPHSFEDNMNQVTATYSLNPDGSVKVINRGFNQCEQKWEQAEGKAKFVENKDKAYLKVSFFGPFYGSYIAFKLGPIENNQYQYAFVSGPDTDYLWLLARQKTIDSSIKQDFVNLARQAGFNENQIIWTDTVDCQH